MGNLLSPTRLASVLAILSLGFLTQCAEQSPSTIGSWNAAEAGPTTKQQRKAEKQAKKRSSSGLPANLPAATDSLNDTARFLAGMPGSNRSPFAAQRNAPEWRKLQVNLDHLFTYYDQSRASRIDSWRRSQMSDVNPSLVFYPFSGPDYLFAHTFFPGASNYVLCGLEPVGSLPDLNSMTPSEMSQALDNLRKSMGTLLSHSYFITKDMRGDLNRTEIRGALPIVMVFLARSGHQLQSVNQIDLSSSGSPISRAGGGGSAPGFHIVARGPRGGIKNIYYFQEDLSNSNLGSNKRLLSFVRSKGTPVTYLKSASYLMHKDHFSVIRNAILSQSSAVIQDPSGVPYRHFANGDWNLRLYGRYSGTLDMFKSYYQKDLAEAYRTRGTGPLGFGVGYKQDSMLVAKKRY